jgi:hypothetical protein
VLLRGRSGAGNATIDDGRLKFIYRLLNRILEFNGGRAQWSQRWICRNEHNLAHLSYNGSYCLRGGEFGSSTRSDTRDG